MANSVMYTCSFSDAIYQSEAVTLTKDGSVPSGKILGGFSITFSGLTYYSQTTSVELYDNLYTDSDHKIYGKSQTWNTSQGIYVSSNDSYYNKSKYTKGSYLKLKLNADLPVRSGSTGLARVTFEFADPVITWSNASLTLSQDTTSRQVTATKGGTATYNGDSSVRYYLYEGSTAIGQFKYGNTLTFTPSAGSHTYKTVAAAGSTTADGATNSITVVEPALTWSNPSLSLVQSQSSTQVTATMGGTATHSRGLSVTYYLYEGNTQIGTFSNNTITFTATVGSHTYKTIATAGGLTADGATTTTTVVGAELYWEGAYLFLVQDPNSLSVTATMGGTATHTFGEPVDYYLYEGSTQIGQFSTSEMTFYASVGDHTYKTVASAGGLTADGAATSISVVEPGPPPLPVSEGTVGYYDGTQFVECEVYRYNGTSYEQMIPYYYDGTDWVECSQ